jgi:hypothetical protein
VKKYKVIKTCTFHRRYWAEGTLTEFDDAVVPPHHFQLVEDTTVIQKKKEDDAVALSQVKNRIDIPNSGFSYDNEKPKVNPKKKK